MNKRICFALIVVFFLMLSVWQLILFSRDNFFSLRSNQVFYLEMLLSNRIDPLTTVEESLTKLTENIKKKFSGLKINIRPKGDEDRMAKEEDEPFPVVTLLYEKVMLKDREAKRYVGFVLNSKAAYDQSFFTGRNWGKSVMMVYQPREKKFTEKDYDSLKNEFPNIQYNLEEISFLRDNGSLLALLKAKMPRRSGYGANPLSISFNQFSKSKDRSINLAMKNYAGYFCSENSLLCKKEATKYKVKFCLILTLFAICIFCLFWLFRSHVMKACIWIRKIISYLRDSSRKKAEKKRMDQMEKEIGAKIIKEADFVEARIRSELGDEEFEKDRYFKALFRIARQVKKAETIERRERSLSLVIEAFEARKNKKLDSVAIVVPRKIRPIVYEPVFFETKEEEIRIERREALLKNLAELFPEIDDIDLQFWKNNELERLISVVRALQEMDQELVYLLFAHPDFKLLVNDARQLLRHLILDNQQDEIRKLLELNNACKKELVKKEEYFLPADLVVVIIVGGGLKNGERQKEVEAEILRLGAKEVEFCDEDKLKRIESIAKKTDSNLLFVGFHPSHSSKIKTKKRFIFANWINPRMFAEEVAKAYETSIAKAS